MNITDYNSEYMELAARLSEENIDNGGGPFGAVIVKDGEIVSTGVNRVTATNDPTAHAEVSAIRAACQKLNSFSLQGCVVYSSCEPCPMCLSALYWAGVSKIYYSNTKEDAASINFSDKFFYEQIALPYEKRQIPCIHIDTEATKTAFEKWRQKTDKILY